MPSPRTSTCPESQSRSLNRSLSRSDLVQNDSIGSGSPRLLPSLRELQTPTSALLSQRCHPPRQHRNSGCRPSDGFVWSGPWLLPPPWAVAHRFREHGEQNCGVRNRGPALRRRIGGLSSARNACSSCQAWAQPSQGNNRCILDRVRPRLETFRSVVQRDSSDSPDTSVINGCCNHSCITLAANIDREIKRWCPGSRQEVPHRCPNVKAQL